jgi:hypothetical protein
LVFSSETAPVFAKEGISKVVKKTEKIKERWGQLERGYRFRNEWKWRQEWLV